MFENNELGKAIRARFTGRRTGLAVGVLALLVVAIAAFSRTMPADEPLADAAAAAMADTADAAAGAAASGTEPDDLARGDSAAIAETPAALPPITDAMFAFAPITDGVPRMRKPEAVRGLYLNAWAAGSTAKLAKLIDIARRTEINAFVIDVKEVGEISYRSRVPLARAIGADRAYIGDVRGMLRKLRDAGIYPIARIVVFRDAVLADAYSELSVQHVDGGEWQDRDDHRWVDSFNRKVWDYNIALAREALELGFAEVQWDYVRFPDVPQSLMRTAVWPAQQGRTKADAIREFLQYSREQLAPYDALVTADVFGLTTSARTDMGIGQLWEKMADATDVLLPMVYPSHYARGSYGIAHPNAQPYETVATAMRHAVQRNAGIENAAAIRPWLQDFTLGQPRYGPAHVRAQIDAVHAEGIDEWVLWHPGSNYTVEALATADGVVPKFDRLDVESPEGAGAQKSNGLLGEPVRVDGAGRDSSGARQQAR